MSVPGHHENGQHQSVLHKIEAITGWRTRAEDIEFRVIWLGLQAANDGFVSVDDFAQPLKVVLAYFTLGDTKKLD